MSDIQFNVDLAPSSEDIDKLGDGLSEHAVSIVKKDGFEPIAIFARDYSGGLIGGAYGQLNWEWLHLSLLWVDSAQRQSGMGARLLKCIEEEAIARGCIHAHLNTFSYQARPFYEKRGYEVFAELDDYPKGHQRVFMKKRLVVL